MSCTVDLYSPLCYYKSKMKLFDNINIISIIYLSISISSLSNAMCKVVETLLL